MPVLASAYPTLHSTLDYTPPTSTPDMLISHSCATLRLSLFCLFIYGTNVEMESGPYARLYRSTRRHRGASRP